LLFIGGYADFYQPSINPTGEIASSVLALATGRGPRVLANVDRESPLFLDDDVVAFGFRDEQESSVDRSQPLAPGISAIDMATIRRSGIAAATARALARLATPDTGGFWIHFDADVLDDAVMPAVDHRLGGGLSWEEVEHLLRTALDSPKALGLQIVSFNPRLDRDGTLAARFVEMLVAVLPAAAADART
jgi:arginase